MHRSLLPAVLFLSVLLSTLVAAQDASYTFTTLGNREGFDTRAVAINNHGQIVGVSQINVAIGGLNHGFLYDNGVFTLFDVPGAKTTSPLAINDQGQIVGYYVNQSGAHGFLYENDVFIPLDVPGATGTYATAINNRGQIVGFYDDSQSRGRGFLYDDGAFTTIDPPDASFTDAPSFGYAINDRGQNAGS
jgi:chitinase